MVLSAVKELLGKMRFWYYHYQITTTIIMMEPMEKFFCNAFLVFFISLFLYTTVVFLPGHAVMMFHFLLHITGVVAYNETHGEMNTEGLARDGAHQLFGQGS